MVDILIPRSSGTTGLRDDISRTNLIEIARQKFSVTFLMKKCVVLGFHGEWERKERL